MWRIFYFFDMFFQIPGVFDGALGFGHTPAVIVVDFTKAYTTPGSPFYCNGRGFGVTDAVAESKSLLHLARTKGVPIVSWVGFSCDFGWFLYL